MNPVDRAFAIEQNKLQAKIDKLRDKARCEFPTLEIEINELRQEAAKLWIEICEAEGLTPEQMQRGERLFTSDENYALAEKYDAVSKLFTVKLKRYKVYCNLLGIEPKFKKRGSSNEQQHKRVVGESDERSTDTGRRQHRPNQRRRIPRRGAAGNNRRK